MLADEMGLGKTLQTISLLAYLVRILLVVVAALINFATFGMEYISTTTTNFAVLFEIHTVAHTRS